MNLESALGWTSSLVLVLTIAVQIFRQWKHASSRGVSPWLYIGQAVGSAGLFIYSLLSEEWVFVALNSMMIVASASGLMIWMRFRHQ